MNSNEIYVSLDIGTSSVKVIIGEMVNDSGKDTLNIIGVGNVKSEGLRKGSIVDMDDTVHSIKRAIEQAERMIGMEIREVVVGISGRDIMLQNCHGIIAVSSQNREITNEDVIRVIEASHVGSIPPERENIGVIRKQFILDGKDEINDPRGMIGVRLEMDGTLITGSKSIIINTLRCVERAGLDILDIILQPLAAGDFALSKDEKNLGVALIDIGGGSTTIAVFEEGFLKATSVIPVGGDLLTNDLSKVLHTSTEDAENIKIKYGHAFYDNASEDEFFSVPIIGSDQHQQFNQLYVSEIIEARMEEIFELIAHELKRLGVMDLPGGFVLTGGTAKMQGVLELAQDMFQNPVRIASPDYIGVREPQYTTAVGLIKYAYKNARLPGGTIGSSTSAVAVTEPIEKRIPKQHQPKTKVEKQPEEKMSSKVKKFLGYFFE
ncbi:cell division protein FtsA [Neobacillus cucumis]|uniref:cell division protein FtsA n=1 Tax=Neobacillus cucumis TaxID=1740721 RepID=UPI001962A069|nr:cell division protein FtsA [Neobacillus cucumis]MBM7654061.1 cell division protein FtsA [Neobacillus cucumis]MED4226081.1 cell division protein FtsA [Neobacillus cucumis]